MEWAHRVSGRASGAALDAYPSSTLDAGLGRLYRLVRRFPRTGRTVDALLARIPPHQPPGDDLRQQLVAALTGLAHQDAELARQVAALTRELLVRRDFERAHPADPPRGAARDDPGGFVVNTIETESSAVWLPPPPPPSPASPAGVGSIRRDESSDVWLKQGPEAFEAEVSGPRWRWITRPRRRSPDPARQGAAPNRYLLAHLPARVPLHTQVSLVVRVSTRSAGPATTAARLDRLTVPAEGAEIAVLVQAPAGLLPTGPLEQVLLVPATGDAEPLRFAFSAVVAGLHRVRVMAFAGGTFLAELDAEVSVEPGGTSVDGAPAVARLDDVREREGEVTLQVRSSNGRAVFQLLSDTWLFEPVPAEALAGDPPAAVERAVTTLRQLATGQGPYSGSLARRWMRETGIGLWERVVPGVIKEQYWQLRDRITSFTIATSHDVIPWELLYPLRPGSDDGFLVEQFPVLRRVFGQQRRNRVAIAPCTYVVSGRAPANTRQEIDVLSAVLGSAGVVEDLGELLDLLGSGRCGPLHFVCHNSFSVEAGSSIAMTGGPFVPGLLTSAAVQHSLAATSPLVFLNACRTAGTALEYSTMIGWAQQFMAAGAGAFVGTLWPVRSDSAGTFAESFYTHLQGGESLGRAALLARRTAVQDGPDPTWLAYTVYGDPHAHAT